MDGRYGRDTANRQCHVREHTGWHRHHPNVHPGNKHCWKMQDTAAACTFLILRPNELPQTHSIMAFTLVALDERRYTEQIRMMFLEVCAVPCRPFSARSLPT